MKVELKVLEEFKKNAKRLSKKYRTLSQEIGLLGELIKQNPKIGTQLGGSLYKIRLASNSKNGGKSGGFRIITYMIEQTSNATTVYLVTIYDKSEESSIAKKTLLNLVKDTEI
ncbi:MAG: addiction module toxin RelE [Emticicia sp.]